MKTLKFLIIEDLKPIKSKLTFLIEKDFNFQCINYESKEELLRVLNKEEPDLIILGNNSYGEDYINKEIISKSVVFKVGIHTLIDLQYHENIPSNLFFEEVPVRIKKHFKIKENTEHSKYTKITIDSLNYVQPLEYDLFIRLSSGRFLKFLKKEYEITLEEINRYKERNINFFFIEKNAVEWEKKDFLEFSKAMINNPSEIISLKIPQSELSIMINTTNEQIQVINSSIVKVKNAILKNKEIKKIIKQFNLEVDDENLFKEKVKLISLISCTLLKSLNWGYSFENFIYSAYLHDILLANHPHLLKIKDEFELSLHNFSEEDNKLFRDHPIITANLIKKDPIAPKEAYSIISQHHEKSDGKGFPLKINHIKMSPFSCLFIYSHDLALYIIKNKKCDINDFVKKNSYRGTVFSKIIGASKEIF